MSVDWNHALSNWSKQVPAVFIMERCCKLQLVKLHGDPEGFPRRHSNEAVLGDNTNHKHSMSGSVNGITATDNSEVRPSSFGVNYIIKL